MGNIKFSSINVSIIKTHSISNWLLGKAGKDKEPELEGKVKMHLVCNLFHSPLMRNQTQGRRERRDCSASTASHPGGAEAPSASNTSLVPFPDAALQLPARADTENNIRGFQALKEIPRVTRPVVPHGLILPPGGHSATSADIICHNGRGVLLASHQQRPRTLLNSLPHTGQPPNQDQPQSPAAKVQKA